MKVAIIVYDLNIRGGTHKQVLRLCQYLRNQNIDFVLCSSYYDAEKTYPEFSAFEVLYLNHNLNTKNSCQSYLINKINLHCKYISEQKQLYNLIPKDVDIINVHDTGLDYLIYFAKKDKKKVVWQINDLHSIFNVGVHKNASVSWRTKLKRTLIRRLTKNVDSITVNVSKNKKRVMDLFNKNAEVFYCGVDKNVLLEKHTYKTAKNKFMLLSMGVFYSYRNYETLIMVIDEMKKRDNPIHLDIIGSTTRDNEYVKKIRNMISEYRLENDVTILGQVDEQTYNNLFNISDAFAFINIDQSWGLAVFEAMSCGLPVIVSNSVGATELLNNEQDSIIVNPTNVEEICSKIQKLINNKKYYEKISNNASNVTKEYTWDNMYSSKMVKLFETLI